MSPAAPPGAGGPRVLHNLQALRGVAVILVLLLHLGNAELLYGPGRTPLSHFAVFGICGVDLFFVISGYLMATLAQGQFQRPGGAAVFLFSRAARIYPPYWVLSLALLAAHRLLPSLGDAQRFQQVDVVRSLLLLPQEGLPILVVGWTLVHELYFYLVVAATLVLPERLFVRALLLWGCAVAAASAALARWPASAGPVAHVLAHPLTLEFIGGCLAARLIGSSWRRWGRAALALGAVLLPALYAAHASLRPQQVPEGWVRVAVFGVPALLLVGGACSLEAPAARRRWRLLEYFGDRSYSLYLTHVPVIVAVSQGWRDLAPSGETGALAAAARAAAVLAAGSAAYAAVELPLHRAARSARGRWQRRSGGPAAGRPDSFRGTAGPSSPLEQRT